MAMLISSSSKFPAIEDIKDAMASAGTSIEATEYLKTQVQERASQIKPLEERERANTVIEKIGEFLDYVRAKLLPATQPWSGEVVESSQLKNMSKNIANSALKDMGDSLANAKLDYAVSKNGHFLRGYSILDKNISDSKTIDTLDKLFQDWLATKDYVMTDGYLYHANENTQEESKRANASTMEELVSDGSLKQYMDKHGITDFTVQTRDYPGEQKEITIEQTIEPADQQPSTHS